MIIRNAAKCALCQEIIQSTHVHHYVTCNCGAIAVDGGNAYLRSAGDRKNFIALYVSTNEEFIPHSIQLENSDVVIAAHHPETCAGSRCALHKRTDHEMRGWVQSLDMIGSTFIITRICPHGIDHTDPDDFYINDIDWCSECRPKHKELVF